MTDKIFETKLDPAAKILVVDDSHLNRCFVENAFTEPEYIVISACDATEGIEKAREEQPELILMDVMMPEINGFSATEMLKEDPATKDIPVIFITALDAVRDKLRAFEVGAVDFVTKPFNHKELIARVYTNIALRRSNAEREQMLMEAMEGQRNKAIAKVAAGVSHNFNNMLTVSTGNMMLLKSMIQDSFDDTSSAAFDDVTVSLKRMQAMVKQFLMLANHDNEVKGGTPAPASTDLHSVVDSALLDKDKDNVRNRVPESTNVFVDSRHISEVLNLVLSEIFEITDGQASCEIVVGEPDVDRIACEIKVDGLSVSPELHNSIFEPFAMPIANVGTGLSLAVAKHIVELNKCEISAEFPSDNQVTFTLSLPTLEV